MKVYIDALSNEELISDSYKPLPPYDDSALLDVAFEVESRKIKVGNEDYGISVNPEEDGGEGEEGNAEVQEVIDIVNNFGYQEMPMPKKEFMSYVKQYVKNLTEHIVKTSPDREAKFKEGFTQLMKKIIADYDNCTIYVCSKSVDDAAEFKAHLVVAHYRDQEVTPRFIYVRDALREEKC